MPLQQFIWVPTGEASGDKSFSVRKAEFGDGYSQAVADGLNNEKQSWPLTFTVKKSEAELIRDFFDQHKGSQSFAWTPPLGTLSLWTVEKYAITPLGANIYRINATFEQAYHP
jgi:phage-related protein